MSALEHYDKIKSEKKLKPGVRSAMNNYVDSSYIDENEVGRKHGTVPDSETVSTKQPKLVVPKDRPVTVTDGETRKKSDSMAMKKPKREVRSLKQKKQKRFMRKLGKC